MSSAVSGLSPLTYYINGYYNIVDQYLTSFNLDAVFFPVCPLEDEEDECDSVSLSDRS